jgi:hypothetical protein
MILAATGFAGTAFAGTALASSTSNSTQTLNNVEPGLLGFLVVAAMGLALVFLLRSMNKQFRKIGPKPEEDLLPEGTVTGEVLSRDDDRSTADASPAD